MKKITLFIFLFIIFITKVNASYIVFDQDNLSVIYGDNIHEKRLIASITKVMSAYVVIKNANLEDVVIIGDEVNKAHGSSIYLKKGEEIKVRDLLYGMLLRSGNDASISLATYVAGSEENFVNLMNNEVRNLGLKNTIFQNSTGLDDDGTFNISTAYDMAYITSIAMKNNVFKEVFKTKKYTVTTNKNHHVWHNKNKALFMDKNITGGKTGYTKKAKRTLITTSSKDNMNLVIVSLGITDDFDFHVNNHSNVFKNYNKYFILNKNKLDIDDNYYNNKKYNFYLKNNYHLISKYKDIKNISIIYELYKIKNIKDNDIVGKAKVYSNNKLIYDAPIYISKV